MKNEIAEFVGSLLFVLLGCGVLVLAGGAIGVLGVALAFGLAWVVASYTTGSQINPAVSVGHFIVGNLDLNGCVRNVVAQCLGAIVGLFILSSVGGDTAGAVTSWSGDQTGALLFEALASLIFVLVVLKVGGDKGLSALGGLIVGLSLTVVLLLGAELSVNPARSLGAAVLDGSDALNQVWLFIVAPVIGAIVAGLLVKNDVV